MADDSARTSRPTAVDRAAPMTDDERDRLRNRAVSRLRGRHPDAEGMSRQELAALVYNLELFQAELEVQNEDLRRARLELARMHDRYRDLYEFAPVGYLTLDVEGVVRGANLAVCSLAGMDRETLVGGRVERVFASDHRDGCYSLLRQAMVDGGRSGELRLAAPQGAEQWVKVDVAPQPAEVDGEIASGFRMTLTDISDRKQAEDALRQANEQLEQKVAERTAELAHRAAQLRALTGELTMAEQRERRRIANILHDHLQQLLVAAKFRLAMLARNGDHGVRDGCEQIDRLLDEAVDASRSLTVQLSPPILADGDLSAGLNWLARWMTDKHGLRVELAVEPDLPPLVDEIKIMLFESVRELLFNVVKHAGVDHAAVDVRTTGGTDLRITVSDSGPGFDPATIRPGGDSAAGLGLFSIGERMEFSGGRLMIDSATGRGCRCTLAVPLSAAVRRA